ncbi:TOBE domain-containing protein [Actinomycetospora cinnamomea]|uniref:TOBE domain-containing protein n=1 Tax=Actinomycetospora cinnamomea TaxID=663609 RepID=UPI000E30E2B4
MRSCSTEHSTATRRVRAGPALAGTPDGVTGPALVVVRPEQVLLEDRDGVSARVLATVFFGHDRTVELALEHSVLTASIPGARTCSCLGVMTRRVTRDGVQRSARRGW